MLGDRLTGHKSPRKHRESRKSEKGTGLRLSVLYLQKSCLGEAAQLFTTVAATACCHPPMILSHPQNLNASGIMQGYPPHTRRNSARLAPVARPAQDDTSPPPPAPVPAPYMARACCCAVQCSGGRRRATVTARRHVTSHVVAPAATCPARRRSRSATTATRHGAFASRPAFGHPDTRAAHASARPLARSLLASSQFLRAPGVHAMRCERRRSLSPPPASCVHHLAAFSVAFGASTSPARTFFSELGFPLIIMWKKRQHVTLHSSSCWGIRRAAGLRS